MADDEEEEEEEEAYLEAYVDEEKEQRRGNKRAHRVTQDGAVDVDEIDGFLVTAGDVAV